jgi:hypothetical protein
LDVGDRPCEPGATRMSLLSGKANRGLSIREKTIRSPRGDQSGCWSRALRVTNRRPLPFGLTVATGLRGRHQASVRDRVACGPCLACRLRRRRVGAGRCAPRSVYGSGRPSARPYRWFTGRRSRTAGAPRTPLEVEDRWRYYLESLMRLHQRGLDLDFEPEMPSNYDAWIHGEVAELRRLAYVREIAPQETAGQPQGA